MRGPRIKRHASSRSQEQHAFPIQRSPLAPIVLSAILTLSRLSTQRYKCWPCYDGDTIFKHGEQLSHPILLSQFLNLKIVQEAPYFVVTHDRNVAPKYITAACFDGGGVRAIAAATVLKAIMDRLEAESLEHFGMLAGTGTGGLLALLLGRLRAPLRVEEIDGTFKDIFRGKFVSRSGSRFKEKMRNIVREYEPGNYAGAQLPDSREDALPVYVLAPQTDYTSGNPIIMRLNDAVDPGTVVDAALVTTPTHFLASLKSIINFLLGKKDNSNGSMGHSNPTLLLIREARKVYGPGVRFTLLLSVESGAEKKTKTSSQERATYSNDIHELVLDMFTSTDLGVYVRLAVPGLDDFAQDDCSAIQAIKEETEKYLKTDEAGKAIDRVVDALRPHARAITKNPLPGTDTRSRSTNDDDGDTSRQ